MINLTTIKSIIFVPQYPPYRELKTSYKLGANICYTYTNKVGKYPQSMKNCYKSLKGQFAIENWAKTWMGKGNTVVNIHMKRCSTSLITKGLLV